MKALENTVIKNGFTYNLICRTEEYALYEQIDRDGLLAGHEGFKIKIGEEKEVFGQLMPKRELFPADADFGITAWSYGINRDHAIERFTKIEEKFKDKA